MLLSVGFAAFVSAIKYVVAVGAPEPGRRWTPGRAATGRGGRRPHPNQAVKSHARQSARVSHSSPRPCLSGGMSSTRTSKSPHSGHCDGTAACISDILFFVLFNLSNKLNRPAVSGPLPTRALPIRRAAAPPGVGVGPTVQLDRGSLPRRCGPGAGGRDVRSTGPREGPAGAASDDSVVQAGTKFYYP